MAMEAVFEDKELRKFLQNMDERLAEVKDGKKQYMGLLSAIIFKDVIEHFEKEEGPNGKWKPWSAIYRKHMADIGKSGNKILQFDGRMRNTFKPTNSRASSDGISWFNNAKTKGGFPYAAAHDEGGGKLPQREFMWASDNALEKMAGQTLAFILEAGV
jgi:phage gpG-like protein